MADRPSQPPSVMWNGGQEARGEQRGAILAPLALLDTDQPVHTCNVRQLQADDFTDAQRLSTTLGVRRGDEAERNRRRLHAFDND